MSIWLVSALLYWTMGAFMLAWVDEDRKTYQWVKECPIGGLLGYALLLHWLWPIYFISYIWNTIITWRKYK